MPCKHVFAVLQHGGICWDDFPSQFRNNPLFTLDDDAEKLLDPDFDVGEDMRDLAQQLEDEFNHPFGIFNEAVGQPSPSQDDNDAFDENNIPDSLPVAPDSQTDQDGAKRFQALRRIRELCRGISENTYLLEEHIDPDKAVEVSQQLADINDEFTAAAPDGIPRLKSSDLRYKTLKKLSQDSRRYKGRRVEQVKRRVGNRGVKRGRGDPLGMQELNRIVRSAAKDAKQVASGPKVYENLWSNEDYLPDEELNSFLEEHHSDIFVPADVQRGLAEGG